MAQSDSLFNDLDSLVKEYNAVYKGYETLDQSQNPSNSDEYQVLLSQMDAKGVYNYKACIRQNAFFSTSLGRI